MPWLSLPDYSRQTGTPEPTVRLAIRKGALRAELEQRAPGDSRTVWRVWLDDPQDQPQEAATAPTSEDAPSEAPQAQTTLTAPPAAIIRLVEELRAMREDTTDRLDAAAVRIADLRERVGRAEAARAAAEQRAADLAERLRAAEWRWWH